MGERRASCCCGQLFLVCQGDPVRVSMCHCLECQRRTGSAFGAQCRWPIERVTTTGHATLYTRTGDEGGHVTFRFCPTCGSTVWWTLDTLPGFVVIALGAFADPPFPPPTVSFYGHHRHAWVTLPASVTEQED